MRLIKTMNIFPIAPSRSRVARATPLPYKRLQRNGTAKANWSLDVRLMSKTDTGCRLRASTTATTTAKESVMPEVTIVYWRDIPAQVIIGKGRRASKVQLPERFEQAIDRCAMKIGARDGDSYLAEWRKAAPYEVEGEPDDIAAAEAARLVAEHDTERLKTLIANDGWA